MPPTYTFAEVAQKTRAGETSRFVFIANPFRFELVRSPSSGNDAIDARLYADNGTTVLTSAVQRNFAPSTPPLYPDLAPIARDLLTLDRPNIANTTAPAYLTDYYKNVRIGWKDYMAGSYTVETPVYTLVNGAVQVGEDTTYGQNVAAYMSSLDFEGRFLTMFAVPTIWYTETDVFSPILMHLVGQTVVDEQTAVPAGAVRVRHRIDGGAWVYAPNYQATGLGLVGHPALYDGGTLLASVTGAQTAQAEVWWSSDGSIVDAQIIETLNCKVREACNNPLFVSWMNSKGGFDVWCFEGKRPVSLEAETVAQYSVQLGDMAEANSTRRTARKEAQRIMQATALGLTLDEANALAEILHSPTVAVYLNNIWQYVNVEGGVIIDEYNSTHRLDFEFILPETQTIS